MPETTCLQIQTSVTPGQTPQNSKTHVDSSFMGELCNTPYLASTEVRDWFFFLQNTHRNEQHDAHEFFTTLLLDIYQEISSLDSSQKCDQQYLHERHELENYFQSMILTKKKCKTCGHEWLVYFHSYFFVFSLFCFNFLTVVSQLITRLNQY